MVDMIGARKTLRTSVFCCDAATAMLLRFTRTYLRTAEGVAIFCEARSPCCVVTRNPPLFQRHKHLHDDVYGLMMHSGIYYFHHSLQKESDISRNDNGARAEKCGLQTLLLPLFSDVHRLVSYFHYAMIHCFGKMNS